MSLPQLACRWHRASWMKHIIFPTETSCSRRFYGMGRCCGLRSVHTDLRGWEERLAWGKTAWVSFSTNRAESDTNTGTAPSKQGPAKVRTPTATSTPTWERAAKRVKNTNVEKNNTYMQEIRAAHDPSMHLKTIEDELKETIGAALGKQGRKILQAMELMQACYDEYESAIAEHDAQNDGGSNSKAMNRAKKAAVRYNQHRQKAVTARWELQVHRQAVGFVTNNHNTVLQHYPIPDALPVDENGNEIIQDKKQKAFDKFGDQLDWWQRVGRWK